MLRFFAGISLCAVCCAASAASDEVTLVADGVAKCRVVVADDASRPEKFGAQELAKYLAKATGCDEKGLGIREQGTGERISVRVSVDGGLVKSGELQSDGFVIDVKPTGIDIIGANPRGALYGCYELLKKYAGMRWLVPGEDGEYCVHEGNTVKVPVGREVQNPYLRIRETRANTVEGFLWHARNNMLSEMNTVRFVQNGKRTKDCDMLEDLAVRGVGKSGHIMSDLLIGPYSGKEREAKRDELFAAHPEWFPLIKGARVKILGSLDANPCVSNPALLDHLAENLYEAIKGPHGCESYVTIGNNDTTIWCECEKCKALDAPERKGTPGAMSDRYWFMVGEIAKRVWKKLPEGRFGGWAYQNYWYPPVRTPINPRLKVFVSFNNQCWRHHCLDPKCTINPEMKKIYSMWKATGLPLVVNRDEISCSGNPGSDFLPSESVLHQNFIDYKEMGCSGTHFCVGGPYPRFLRYAKTWKPFYGHNDEWYAMWQTCYLSARFEWDLNRDYAKEYEEANSLYYGKIAWEGAMKDFRKTLEKAFFETPGCIGWGSGAPLGRCLDQAGMEQKLKGLLEKAVALAKTDPDPRALQHVEMEKSIFERTWLVERKVYVDNFKELNVYRRAGEIRVDGVLDEADWKNADVLGNFKAPDWGKVKTEDLQQTFVRVTYDHDHLYFAVEAMEPTPAKMKAGKNVDRTTGYGELGNHVELFYSFPDMAERCYQLMVNSEGQMYDVKVNSVSDKDTSFRTTAKWAVRKGKDRWTLEIAIPCSEIGQNCFDGATWRLNVARQREVEGAPRETSSCCNGGFYAPATFINMKFTPARATGIGQAHDTAPWKNASFDDWMPNPTDKRFTWTKWQSPEVPKAWSGKGMVGACREENGNRYIHLEAKEGSDQNSDLSQYFVGPGKGTLRITFRARGTGKFAVWSGNYSDEPRRHIIDGTSSNHPFELTPEWKTYSFEVKKLGIVKELVANRIRLSPGASLDLDDYFITPDCR